MGDVSFAGFQFCFQSTIESFADDTRNFPVDRRRQAAEFRAGALLDRCGCDRRRMRDSRSTASRPNAPSTGEAVSSGKRRSGVAPLVGLFLFVWMPQNTFYRLFYLPALIRLTMQALSRFRPALPYLVTGVACWNYAFVAYPQSRNAFNPALTLPPGRRRNGPRGRPLCSTSFTPIFGPSATSALKPCGSPCPHPI
jgi:hypothetical protein